MREFKECESCAAKPGSPTLCEACIHNKFLASDFRELEKENESLKRCGNCKHLSWQAGDGPGVYHMCDLPWGEKPFERREDTSPEFTACKKWELCK